MKQNSKDLSLHVLLIIFILILTAVFIQNFKAVDAEIIKSIGKTAIGFVVSNYGLKNKKLKAKIVKVIKSKAMARRERRLIRQKREE